jgi:hypothetical protein
VIGSTGSVGIGTATPFYPLDINANVIAVGTTVAKPGFGGALRFRDDTGTPRWLFGLLGSSGATTFNVSDMINHYQPFIVQAGAPTNSFVLTPTGVGIGTASPAHKLDVVGDVRIAGVGHSLVFPDGTEMTSAGVGTNGGTITSVNPGTGLSGGGTAGSVTLNIASASCSAGMALTGLPLTCSPFATLGANTFVGNQGITGIASVVASGVGATALSVQATDTSAENTAISGLANGAEGVGVVGTANNGTTAAGVWGISTTGVAGLFSGDVSISGTLDAQTKNFKIDDPMDPANKFLVHASVESSEMKTIYDGTVTLDARGEALVRMPDWFEALNTEFRYQLTCVGGYAPVFIAQKIQNGEFRIAGGTAGLEVDWQVTGVRHDPYAEAHPLRVVVDKPAKERGYYIRPELYGAPPSRSLDRVRHPNFVPSPR